MKVVFRHYKNVGKTKLRRFIDDARATGQINTYDRPCTPFKDILQTDHVTVCTIEEEIMCPGKDENEIKIYTGYAFCRGDLFLRESGRHKSQNRARAQADLPLLQDPLKDRQKATRAAAAARHAENRKRGLERQEEVGKARQQVEAEAAD